MVNCLLFIGLIDMSMLTTLRSILVINIFHILVTSIKLVNILLSIFIVLLIVIMFTKLIIQVLYSMVTGVVLPLLKFLSLLVFIYTSRLVLLLLILSLQNGITLQVPTSFVDYYNPNYSNYILYGTAPLTFIENMLETQTISIVNAINNSNNTNTITNSINNSTNVISNTISDSTSQITNSINNGIDSIISTDTSQLTDIAVPNYILNISDLDSIVTYITDLVKNTLFNYDYDENVTIRFNTGFLGFIEFNSNKLWFISHHPFYQVIINGLACIIVLSFFIHLTHRFNTGRITDTDSDINITDAL